MVAPRSTACKAAARRRSSAGARPAAPSDALEENGERLAANARGPHCAKPRQLGIAERGRLETQEPGMLWGFVEQVLLRTQERFGAHDNLLADRVDRRVGHLGEELLEVAGQELAAPAEHRQRDVRTHARDRLLAVLGHGQKDAEDIFLGIAECLLPG